MLRYFLIVVVLLSTPLIVFSTDKTENKTPKWSFQFLNLDQAITVGKAFSLKAKIQNPTTKEMFMDTTPEIRFRVEDAEVDVLDNFINAGLHDDFMNTAGMLPASGFEGRLFSITLLKALPPGSKLWFTVDWEGSTNDIHNPIESQLQVQFDKSIYKSEFDPKVLPEPIRSLLTYKDEKFFFNTPETLKTKFKKMDCLLDKEKCGHCSHIVSTKEKPVSAWYLFQKIKSVSDKCSLRDIVITNVDVPNEWFLKTYGESTTINTFEDYLPIADCAQGLSFIAWKKDKQYSIQKPTDMIGYTDELKISLADNESISLVLFAKDRFNQIDEASSIFEKLEKSKYEEENEKKIDLLFVEKLKTFGLSNLKTRKLNTNEVRTYMTLAQKIKSEEKASCQLYNLHRWAEANYDVDEHKEISEILGHSASDRGNYLVSSLAKMAWEKYPKTFCGKLAQSNIAGKQHTDQLMNDPNVTDLIKARSILQTAHSILATDGWRHELQSLKDHFNRLSSMKTPLSEWGKLAARALEVGGTIPGNICPGE